MTMGPQWRETALGMSSICDTLLASALPRPMTSRWFLRALAALFCFVFTLRACLHASDTPAPLTTAAQVLALSPEASIGKLPVRLRGVVTAAEPDWAGKFVVQDESAGVFVQNVGNQPQIGDVVELTGVTDPGWFAPVVQCQNAWRKVGTAPLPVARQVSIERLMTGVEASQRVEITGLVRSVSYVPSQKTMVEISIGGHRVRVFPKLPSGLNPRSLVAAKVTVRGTAATSFNAARRHLTAVNLIVPRAEDFVVEETELHSPWDQPAVALGDIARYRANATLGERMRVRGTLTYQRVGLDCFLQDDTGGLHVETLSPVQQTVGRALEAVGFLEFVNFQPVLRDAVLRELPDAVAPRVAVLTPVEELRDGLHAAEFVSLRGRLIDRSVREVRREAVSFSGVRVLCTIQAPGLTFTAECEEGVANSGLLTVPLGSDVEVQGIAYPDSGDDGRPKALTILLPKSRHLRVLSTPSWFTFGRLLVCFAVVCVLFAAVVGWLLTVAKKNAMLKYLAAEREKARQELQQAHDQLEVRVKERSEQLQAETMVRRAAEVEFRAVLTERTRLARELHDTLEQALTGIALQLDTASTLFRRRPEEAGPPLEVARGLLKQSQLELRRSIWDLRSRELEQFDLAGALRIASRQLTEAGRIAVEIDTVGERRRLPEIVEENLLRIAQEAMTNVLKHSGATLVTVRLTYEAMAVILEIRDNGAGLALGPAGAEGRHFGLLGMSERAKRIGGRLEVSSAPGEGVVVRAFIALAPGAASTIRGEEQPAIL